VVANLLGNAWKHTPALNRRLELHARSGDRRHVIIEVCDNGPGVPEVERRRIFEEFERGRAAMASRAAGFGLGLAIVRGVVRAHSGRVELADNPGGGSIFRVVLPRRPKLAHEVAAAAPAEVSAK
jgi:two-component system OmpR family sensor kinase